MRVLVCCEQKQIVQLAKICFQRTGHEVLIAADRETAIELARAEQPDVVVVDIRWSDIAESLSGDPTTSGIRVMVLSANTPIDREFWVS